MSLNVVHLRQAAALYVYSIKRIKMHGILLFFFISVLLIEAEEEEINNLT